MLLLFPLIPSNASPPQLILKQSSSFTFALLCWAAVLCLGLSLKEFTRTFCFVSAHEILWTRIASSGAYKNYSTLIVLWFYYVFFVLPLLLPIFVVRFFWHKWKKQKREEYAQPKKKKVFAFCWSPKVDCGRITCKTDRSKRLFCVRENRKFEKCATHSRKSAMKCATLELSPLCGADDKKRRERAWTRKESAMKWMNSFFYVRG